MNNNHEMEDIREMEDIGGWNTRVDDSGELKIIDGAEEKRAKGGHHV